MIETMKILLALILFAFIFITVAKAETKLSLPTDAKPFFVHRSLADAWGKPVHNGFYCYAVEKKGVLGPFVDIYIVKQGKVTEVVSQGSHGRELMKRIRKSGLKPFAYSDEVDKTVNRLTAEYKKNGKKYYPPMVLDGHSYEIVYELDDVKYEIYANNPGYEIYELSRQSEKIGKLYAVYKELMLYYAERKFDFK